MEIWNWVKTHKRTIVLTTIIASASAVAVGAIGFLVTPIVLKIPPAEEIGKEFTDKIENLAKMNEIRGVKGEVIAQTNVLRIPIISKDPRNDPKIRLLVLAILRSEDSSFYEHDGINRLAILRCFFWNTWHRKTVCGGSTITQQMVKRELLTATQTAARKVAEMYYAWRLEETVSKDAILLAWINEVFLGGRYYGMGAAALGYYGKEVSELTLGQIAVLAGLGPAPSEINPIKNLPATQKKQRQILALMLKAKDITKAEYDAALAEDISPIKGGHEIDFDSSYPVIEAKELCPLLIRPELCSAGDLVIETTINKKFQRAVELRAQRVGFEHSRRQGWRGSNPATTSDKRRMRKANAVVEMGRAYDGIVTSTEKGFLRVSLENSVGSQVLVDRASWKWIVGSKKAPPVTGDLVTVLVEESTDVSQEYTGSLEQWSEAQVAFIAIDPATRGIVATVGGLGSGTEFDRTSDGKGRGAGSLMKMMLVVAAIEEGLTTTSTCLNTKFTFIDPKTHQPWSPDNYAMVDTDGNPIPRQVLTPRRVIAMSDNICSGRLLFRLSGQPIDAEIYNEYPQTGIDKVVKVSEAVGISIPKPQQVPSVILGVNSVTLRKITNAYATLVAEGVYEEPYLIERITTKQGKVLYAHPRLRKQAMNPAVAYMTLDVLRATVEDDAGTATLLRRLPWAVGGKTGTTQSSRDARFIGVSPRIAIGCWIGYDNEERNLGKKETGGKNCVPAFVDLDELYEGSLLQGLPSPPDFPGPEGVVRVYVNHDGSKLVPLNDPSGRWEVYVKGTEPQGF